MFRIIHICCILEETYFMVETSVARKIVFENHLRHAPHFGKHRTINNAFMLSNHHAKRPTCEFSYPKNLRFNPVPYGLVVRKGVTGLLNVTNDV